MRIRVRRAAAAAVLALAAGCVAPGAPLPAAPVPEDSWGDPRRDLGREPGQDPHGDPYADPYGDREARSGYRRWLEQERVTGTLLPYVWSAASRGEVAAGGMTGSVTEGDPAGSGTEEVWGGRFEAFYQRVAFFLESFYAHAGATENGVEGDIRYGMIQLGAAQRLAGDGPGPIGERTGPGSLFLDGIVAARYHYAGSTVDAGNYQKYGNDLFWIEPVGGVRAGVTLLRRLTASGSVDVGGMITNEWDSWSWDTSLSLRLDLTDNLGVAAGYRWYGTRHEDREAGTTIGTDVDLRLEGVWAGLVLTF